MPDPAREAIGQRRILLALDLGDDVEHGLVLAARHLKTLKLADPVAAPYLDRHRIGWMRSRFFGAGMNVHVVNSIGVVAG